jgi:hypothetical protein
MALSDNIDNPLLWASELLPAFDKSKIFSSIIPSLKSSGSSKKDPFAESARVAVSDVMRDVNQEIKKKRTYNKKNAQYWNSGTRIARRASSRTNQPIKVQNITVNTNDQYDEPNNSRNGYSNYSSIGGVQSLEVINASDDIVQPLLDGMRKNLLDNNELLIDNAVKSESLLSQIRDEVQITNRGYKKLVDKKSYFGLDIGKILNPVNWIGGAWAALFGNKEIKIDQQVSFLEKIHKAILDQTEFFMTGKIADKTKKRGVLETLFYGGLVGGSAKLLTRGVGSLLGVNQQTANERAKARAEGKQTTGFFGGLADKYYGKTADKYGTSGGFIDYQEKSEQKSQHKIAHGESPNIPLYVVDGNVLLLSKVITEGNKHLLLSDKETFEEQKLLNDHTVKVIDLSKENHKTDKKIKHELEKLNRRTFWQLLGSGISSIASGIFSVGSKIAGIAAPLLVAIAAGFAGLMKLLKRTNLLLNLQTIKALKDTYDIGKSIKDAIFGDGKNPTDGIFPSCVRICGKGESPTIPTSSDSRDDKSKDKPNQKTQPKTSMGAKVAGGGALAALAATAGVFYTSEGDIDTLKEAEYKKFKELQLYKDTSKTKEEKQLENFQRFMDTGNKSNPNSQWAKKFPDAFKANYDKLDILKGEAYLAKIRRDDENTFGYSAERKVASEFANFSPERMEELHARLRMESSIHTKDLTKSIAEPMTVLKETAEKQLEISEESADVLKEYVDLIKTHLSPDQVEMLDRYQKSLEPEKTWIEKGSGWISNKYQEVKGAVSGNSPSTPQVQGGTLNLPPPSTFGQEAPLPDNFQPFYKNREGVQPVPMQTPSIPNQSMTVEQGDSKVVEMLSSIDSKLSNVNNQSPSADVGNNVAMAGGHDKRTVFSIFGEGAVV